MSDLPTMHQIFLSHASEDKTEVLKFAELLQSRPLAKQHGIGVWVDKTHVTSMETYTAQFAKAIHDRDTTCGFILYMPEKNAESTELKPWVDHEVEQALERRMRDKADKKVFPILYVYPGKRRMRMEPPVIIANCICYQSVYDDDEVADDILSDIVVSLTANKTQSAKSTPEKTGTLITGTITDSTTATTQPDKTEGQWLSFVLSLNGEQISCEDGAGSTTHCERKDLQTLFPSPHTKHALQQLFPRLFSQAPDVISRVRLMTNDAGLAMLPWANLLDDYTVEISPVTPFHRKGFNELSIRNPLIVIPAGDKHKLAAGQHLTLLQGYFSEYLGLRAVSRITTAETLKHDMQFNPPDLIYIYARLHQQQILLDSGTIHTTQNEGSAVSLDELGQWISQADNHPLLVANFIGEELETWPQTLVKHCSMVWIQSSEGDRYLNKMTGHFLDKLAQLPQQADLIQLVNSTQPPLGVNSHVWINQQPPLLRTSDIATLSGELRLALLRVMLGRDSLKQTMFGHITDRNNTHAFMTYAVTGSQANCPFDFPMQLQQRLEDWDAQGNEGLQVIPYYFSLDINSDQPSPSLIGRALDEGLLRYARDPEEAFERELKRRGLLNSYKCITLNWSVRIRPEHEQHIGHWLQVWGKCMHNDLSSYIPTQTILLAALCIEVSDQDEAQHVQNRANESLDQLYPYQIRLIENREALGKLTVREIREFLTNSKWYSQLKLDQLPIEPNNYARWVHAEANGGEFEPTVKKLWQQYQNNYQDYLQL